MPDYFLFGVYNKMHPVHLADMSKAVMSKLRNGHSVRAALAAKGSGVPAFLSEDNIKKLMKAGKRGGKAVIRLGTEELHRNRSEGSGIMAGGKLKMGGFKDFKKGFSQGFNAMGGVDGIVGAAEMMAGAGISAGPAARGGATWIKPDGSLGTSNSFSAGPKRLPKKLRGHTGGKLKGFKGNPIKDVKNLAQGKAVRACGEGFLKDMGHSFIHTTNQLGTPIISDYTKNMEGGKIDPRKIGSGISAGPAARGGAVRATQVQAIAKKIASEAAKKVKGGKLKMKSITHAISSIAKNPTVQNIALDMAKDAMGAGLIAGGKLKMKDITHHIGTIASNPHIQQIAMDTLQGVMGGEGIFAGATHGGSVKRRAIDLIEDIGENRPRKRGESRVRQAIDLVETMRKPRGKGMYAGSRGGKMKLNSNRFAIPSGVRERSNIVAMPSMPTQALGNGFMKDFKSGFSGTMHALGGPENAIKIGSTLAGAGLYAGTRGGAIGPNGQLSGITNVGAGGNLMCLTNPALMPQPVSENFFFHTQFPPALASRMEG